MSDYVDFEPWLQDSVDWQTGITNNQIAHPTIIMLQVHPNPFTDRTEIRYSIHDSRYTTENTDLGIYDASGRLVKFFNYESVISWDGTDQSNRELASGVYFVRVAASDYSETKKVLLVR